MNRDHAAGAGDGVEAAEPGSGTLWLDALARPGVLDVEDEHGRRFPVTAERTACEHLRITPCWDATGALIGTWRLSHAPTGLRVPGTDGLNPAQLRAVAEDLADLRAWATSERTALSAQAGYLAARVDQARERALR